MCPMSHVQIHGITCLIVPHNHKWNVYRLTFFCMRAFLTWLPHLAVDIPEVFHEVRVGIEQAKALWVQDSMFLCVLYSLWLHSAAGLLIARRRWVFLWCWLRFGESKVNQKWIIIKSESKDLLFHEALAWLAKHNVQRCRCCATSQVRLHCNHHNRILMLVILVEPYSKYTRLAVILVGRLKFNVGLFFLWTLVVILCLVHEEIFV